MSPKFKANLETLIYELLTPSNLVKKRILGQFVEGNEFGEHTKTFFEKFKSPDTPLITSVYELVIERQMINYFAEAMQKYRFGVNQFVDFNKTREDLTYRQNLPRRKENCTCLVCSNQKDGNNLFRILLVITLLGCFEFTMTKKN